MGNENSVPEWEDRLIPLEDLRTFLRPGLQDTLPPYNNPQHEQFQAGYRKCLGDLMKMLGIKTSASKEDRDYYKKRDGEYWD